MSLIREVQALHNAQEDDARKAVTEYILTRWKMQQRVAFEREMRLRMPSVEFDLDRDTGDYRALQLQWLWLGWMAYAEAQ